MISVEIGTSGQILHFTEEVLQHFARCRQTRFWHREAGGLLFARIVGDDITIEEATGPRRTDRRSRYSYQGDRRAEQREIDQRHARGLDYVGDWHTHPERWPKPSPDDDRAMISRVRESQHQLLGFVFAIVGTASFPNGLTVAIHDGFSRIDLWPPSVR
jgi:integrative and conjugative element protein (TIGR02256 family)